MGHPAHYHNISVVIEKLSDKGHDIFLVARDKDVLFDLVTKLPYKKIYLKKRRGNSKLNLLFVVLQRAIVLFNTAVKFKPDLIIGTDIAITHVGKLLKIPAIVLNEDDVQEIPLFTKYGIRYASCVLSPISCDIGPFKHKTIVYPGYHELAYLHPNNFTPLKEKAEVLFADTKRYFILRFSALASHHDIGKSGITTEIAQRVINLLKVHGNVWISAEQDLAPQFEQYRISIKPEDMHHALYFADMYIGDSQTMTAEAAVLGTPAIRFNDFVGKLGYLEELEHKFHLTFGIKTDNSEELLTKIEELLEIVNLKEQWKKKRDAMLNNTIDVAEFWCWFFENYPESSVIMNENPDYSLRFK